MWIVRQAPLRPSTFVVMALRARVDSSLFSRAEGFLTKRRVGLGGRVKNGQALSELATPELDQQILQASATLSDSQSTPVALDASLTFFEANMNLARKAARIRVDDDHGAEVEVLAGLAAGDKVVMNATDAVRDGVKVVVRKTGDSHR